MSDEDRVAVKTYVPRYQKARWRTHADELDMSQSEFVRTMVQAGRSKIAVSTNSSTPSSSGVRPGFEDRSDREASDRGSNDFESRIRDVLESTDAMDWDQLVDALVDDVEAELDAALERLQADNEIRYSGRNGGYVLTNDE
ncbi:DUF5805 domain-containing protein [Halovivax sp.]|uniref:DUF5805 domain-containing protein n=1 Tax=Halovivax sp. TaxID=1935978 RepID=UPI0025BB37B4|nr:DUF5805 domain-containing protein [Halovivax sp.]